MSWTESYLPQPPGLTLPLEQHEDVALADRALHIPDDRARRVVKELNANLRHLTCLASAPKDLSHLCKLYWLIL